MGEVRKLEGVYERELLLDSGHVDRFRRLRTSALFILFQRMSGAHTEALGMGRGRTADRGLLWVVARQHALVGRMPEYGERVLLRTWPGRMMRVLFPAYYELLAHDGETLVRASAVWALMDRRTRATAFPEEYGIEVEGVETGRELPYLTRIGPRPTPNSFDFTVPNSYVDLNEHMNNARYFDMVEDRLPAVNAGKVLCEAHVEYSGEVRFGETVHVVWGEENGMYYVNGTTEHPCFRMSLTYADGGRV